MSRNVDNKRPLTINLTIPFLLLFFKPDTNVQLYSAHTKSILWRKKHAGGNKQKQNIHERKDVKKKVKKTGLRFQFHTDEVFTVAKSPCCFGLSKCHLEDHYRIFGQCFWKDCSTLCFCWHFHQNQNCGTDWRRLQKQAGIYAITNFCRYDGAS